MVKINVDQDTLKRENKTLKAELQKIGKSVEILTKELNKQSSTILEANKFVGEKKKLKKKLKTTVQELMNSKDDVTRLRDQVRISEQNYRESRKQYMEFKANFEKELADVREKLSKVSEERNTLKVKKRKLEQDAEKSKTKMQRLEGTRNLKVLSDGIEFLKKAQECFSTTGLMDTIKQKTQDDLLSEATDMGYISSITQEMFVDPVRCSDGEVYERKMIKKWFESNDTSPNTNATIYDKTLVTEYRLRSQIEAWKKINNYDEIVAKENTVDLTKK